MFDLADVLADLHDMTELKTCAGPAPGPTRTHLPSQRSTAIEWKGSLEAVFFREDIDTWCNDGRVKKK